MFHLRRTAARSLRPRQCQRQPLGARYASGPASAGPSSGSGRVVPAVLGVAAVGLGAYALGRREQAESDADRAAGAPAPVPTAAPRTGSANPAFDPNPALRHRFGSPDDYAAAVAELQGLFDEDHITTDDEDLAHHGGSAWTYGVALPPSAVVYPETTEDVVKVMKVASRYRVPVVPYGSGTGLEGQFSAVSALGALPRAAESREADKRLASFASLCPR